jgi:hypothetical protein
MGFIETNLTIFDELLSLNNLERLQKLFRPGSFLSGAKQAAEKRQCTSENNKIISDKKKGLLI